MGRWEALFKVHIRNTCCSDINLVSQDYEASDGRFRFSAVEIPLYFTGFRAITNAKFIITCNLVRYSWDLRKCASCVMVKLKNVSGIHKCVKCPLLWLIGEMRNWRKLADGHLDERSERIACWSTPRLPKGLFFPDKGLAVHSSGMWCISTQKHSCMLYHSSLRCKTWRKRDMERMAKK